MASSEALQDCIDRAIKDELKLGDGTTTKQDVLLRARADARKRGIHAEILMSAENQIWLSLIDRRFKRGMPEHATRLMASRVVKNRNVPIPLLKVMKRLPYMIALGEGKDARWAKSFDASVEQWRAHWEMKSKKADETKAKATEALDILRFLEEYGMQSLSDCMDFEEEAA